MSRPLAIGHPSVFILGYSEAAMLLRSPEHAARIRAIVAIHGARDYPVEAENVAHRLVLRFDDIEAPSRTDPIEAARIRLHNREAAERTGLTLTPPAPEHAKAIIDFAHAVRDVGGAVLCQCQGGVSRSSAAALLCLAAWTGPGLEQYCVEQVLAARSCALPHANLIEFGDELLGRQGRLVEALAQAQPGWLRA